MATFLIILKTFLTGASILLILMLHSLQTHGALQSGTAEVLKEIASQGTFITCILIAGLLVLHRKFFVDLIIGKDEVRSDYLEELQSRENKAETRLPETPVKSVEERVMDIIPKKDQSVVTKDISSEESERQKIKDPIFLDNETIWIDKGRNKYRKDKK